MLNVNNDSGNSYGCTFMLA